VEKKILVVDDHFLILVYIEAELEALGLRQRMVMADNGQDAIDELRKIGLDAFSLIILDI